jgi:selenide, water dikinase
MAGLPRPAHPDLLVGPETSDDAGVYRIAADQALVQTIDVITPIFDDPFEFGEIAAANAVSDVFAMGGRPVTALNYLAYPKEDLPADLAREILRGGAAKIAEAGAVVVGGHTVEDKELKYGLAVTGLVDPARMTPNSGARAGDVLVLTKPLGTGIVSSAFRNGRVAPGSEPYAAALSSMRALNRAAAEAAVTEGVRGMTDVTGFGLAGHALELALASGVIIEIDVAAIPLIPDLRDLLGSGCQTGGGKKNAAYYEGRAEIPADWAPIVCDPQTSGGLLVTVPEDRADALLRRLPRDPIAPRVIGRCLPAATPRLRFR